MVWLIFVLAALAIFVAGQTLARNGAIIADRTEIGQIPVGALLIAGVTSLPEITTGSAAVLTDSPNLATGDLFGANMANMALLALIALAFPRTRVIQREALGIVLTASVAIVLTGLAVLFLVARLDQNIAGTFGFGSLVIIVAALAGLFLLPDVRDVVGETGEPVDAGASRRRIRGLARPLLEFGAAAVAVLIAAPLLVDAADEIAEITGLAETFVGVVALALATTLPELATSTAAVRMGALDLAVGNLYGSNAMNMSVLVWLDALYTDAPLLETIDISNAVAGLAAMLLMMIGLTSMVLRAERRRLPFDAAAALILAGYALGVLLVWSVSS